MGSPLCITQTREQASRIWVCHRGEPVLDFPGSFDEFVEKHPDLASQHQ